jgi:asparagine synthase (glutamine-hydrolysing)
MSGIYGIYRWDGAAVDPQWLDQMKQAMAYYGPDGGGCHADGSVALGHLLLNVNPEDDFESQPMQIVRGSVVTAARLDNRQELLEAFEIAPSDAARTPDGALVSRAFDRWGKEVCIHLRGDWALAAWDAHERRLLLARDVCGNTTLYYYEGKGFVAFASSMKALLAIPGVEHAPDALRLAEVLVSWQPDAELTAYKGIRRLVGAHAMSFDAEGHGRTWRYWSAEGREPLVYRRDDDYVEAYLEQYTRAVQSCLRTRKPVAATLSGGRDSGSLVTLAAGLLAAQGRGLTAYTSVPLLATDGAGGQRFGNEWDVAHATAEMAGANVHHVALDAAQHGVLQGIEHLIDCHDGPSHAASNHYWLQAITETAAHNGARVVLTGQMGNAAVSWAGSGCALLALKQHQPKTALRLILQADPNPWLTLKRQVLKPLLTPALRAWRRIKLHGSSPWQAYSALNPQMASQLNLDGRMRAIGYDPTFTFSPLEDTHLRFFWPMWCVGTGFWSEMGAKHSIAFLDPTFNQSLVEFILRVPDDQFRHQGQTSWLMRRAFRNRMPEVVLEGRRKGLQAADVGHRILRELPAMRATLDSFESLPAARELLDLPLLQQTLDDLVAKVDPETTAKASQILLRGMGVGLFLRRFADSPA